MDVLDIIGLVKGGAGAVDAIAKTTKTIKDVLKKPKSEGAADVPPINESLNEILDQTIALKQLQLELIEALISLRDDRLALDEERASVNNFKTVADNYIIKEVSPHSFAYVAKSSVSNDEPRQHFCVPCYDKMKLNLLQFANRDFDFDTLVCSSCSTAVRVPNGIKFEVMTVAPRKRGWDWFDDI